MPSLDSAARRPLPRRTAIIVGVLLAVPVLAILLVPTYARKGPELAGWPFFYWYQVLWVLLSGVFTATAYVLINRARAAGARDE